MADPESTFWRAGWDAYDAEVQAEVFMVALYTSTIRRLEGELERARSVAVRLEQENAALTVGAGRRAL